MACWWLSLKENKQPQQKVCGQKLITWSWTAPWNLNLRSIRSFSFLLNTCRFPWFSTQKPIPLLEILYCLNLACPTQDFCYIPRNIQAQPPSSWKFFLGRWFFCFQHRFRRKIQRAMSPPPRREGAKTSKRKCWAPRKVRGAIHDLNQQEANAPEMFFLRVALSLIIHPKARKKKRQIPLDYPAQLLPVPQAGAIERGRKERFRERN